jgi:hypothetical protein
MLEKRKPDYRLPRVTCGTIAVGTRPRSSMDRVPDFESVGWGFESLRGRHTCGGAKHRHTYLWGFLYQQNRCWFFSGAVPVQLFGDLHLFFPLNYLLVSKFTHI